MNNWVTNFIRPEGAGSRSSGHRYQSKDEARTAQDKANARARRILENYAIDSTVPASDYEYFERMARELEAENLEGVA